MHKFEQVNHRLIVLEQKCIEPLGESKSDYEIFAKLAGKLGVGDIYTEGGLTELDWVKRIFHASDLPDRITWDEFAEKGYYLVPVGEHQQTPALRWFAEGRKRDTPDWGPPPWDTVGGKGLQTQSGKIEFVSSSLKRFYESGDVVDEERPVMGPQYIESWEGHRTEALTADYPLQLISPHPRFSFHTMGDGKDAWAADIEDHRELKDDGWYYWLIRLNSEDAAARGIGDGDLVRAYNDRGSVVLCARTTERVRPGTVHSSESCSDYSPTGELGNSPDRAGCVNILTSKRFITPTSPGQACNTCLIEVEPWKT